MEWRYKMERTHTKEYYEKRIKELKEKVKYLEKKNRELKHLLKLKIKD